MINGKRDAHLNINDYNNPAIVSNTCKSSADLLTFRCKSPRNEDEYIHQRVYINANDLWLNIKNFSPIRIKKRKKERFQILNIWIEITKKKDRQVRNILRELSAIASRWLATRNPWGRADGSWIVRQEQISTWWPIWRAWRIWRGHPCCRLPRLAASGQWCPGRSTGTGPLGPVRSLLALFVEAAIVVFLYTRNNNRTKKTVIDRRKLRFDCCLILDSIYRFID